MARSLPALHSLSRSHPPTLTRAGTCVQGDIDEVARSLSALQNLQELGLYSNPLTGRLGDDSELCQLAQARPPAAALHCMHPCAWRLRCGESAMRLTPEIRYLPPCPCPCCCRGLWRCCS